MNRLASAASCALGAAPLLWPLLVNRYPIVFSDTGGFLEMGLLPSMGWDKPFVYGPLIALLSLHLTLFLPAIAQALLLSFTLWRTQTIFAPPTRWRHLRLCCTLAAITAAPWFASTLMPDILAPIACLALIVAAYRPGLSSTLIAALAIAAHLSLLIMAAALIPALAILRRRLPWRPLSSLALAVALLLVTNLVGHGRLALSPYGSVFALARLIGDGPARTYLDRACPAANYSLCAWRDRLTDDSDQFLWDPNGPFWADPTPLPEFAAQAAQIVRATILSQPLQVLRNAYRNTATELLLDRVGDAVTNDNLNAAVRPPIARWFPAELHRFDASLQTRNALLPIAEALNPLYLAALAAAAAASFLILINGLKHRSPRADLAALILIALAANAFATGALSKPHHRYQARIAWLLLLPVALRFNPYAASNAASPPADRTSCA